MAEAELVVPIPPIELVEKQAAVDEAVAGFLIKHEQLIESDIQSGGKVRDGLRNILYNSDGSFDLGDLIAVEPGQPEVIPGPAGDKSVEVPAAHACETSTRGGWARVATAAMPVATPIPPSAPVTSPPAQFVPPAPPATRTAPRGAVPGVAKEAPQVVRHQTQRTPAQSKNLPEDMTPVDRTSTGAVGVYNAATVGVIGGVSRAIIEVVQNYDDESLSIEEKAQRAGAAAAAGFLDGVELSGALLAASSFTPGAILVLAVETGQVMLTYLTDESKTLVEALADRKEPLLGVTLVGIAACFVGTSTPVIATSLSVIELAKLFRDYRNGSVPKHEVAPRACTIVGGFGGGSAGVAVGAAVGAAMAGLPGCVAGAVVGGIVGSSVGAALGMHIGNFINWLFGFKDPVLAAYGVLDCAPSVSDNNLHKAYWKKMRQVHPDKHATDKEYWTSAAQNVNVAYDLIKAARGLG